MGAQLFNWLMRGDPKVSTGRVSGWVARLRTGDVGLRIGRDAELKSAFPDLPSAVATHPLARSGLTCVRHTI